MTRHQLTLCGNQEPLFLLDVMNKLKKCPACMKCSLFHKQSTSFRIHQTKKKEKKKNPLRQTGFPQERPREGWMGKSRRHRRRILIGFYLVLKGSTVR